MIDCPLVTVERSCDAVGRPTYLISVRGSATREDINVVLTDYEARQLVQGIVLEL